MARSEMIVSRIPTTSASAMLPRKAVLAALLFGLGAALLYVGIPAIKVFADQISSSPHSERGA